MQASSIPLASGANARCAVHRDAAAIETCSRCGDHTCAECVFDRHAARVLCKRCHAIMAADRYHVVPPGRVVLFGLLSLGVYGLVWSYRQWRSIRRQDGSKIWPVARAVFASFSFFLLIHDLNDRIRQANEGGASIPELSSGLGLIYLLIFAAGDRLPEPWSFLSVLSGLCLYPPAKRIAQLAGPEAVAKSRRMTPVQYALCGLGGVLWLLILWTLTLEDPTSI